MIKLTNIKCILLIILNYHLYSTSTDIESGIRLLSCFHIITNTARYRQTSKAGS